MSSRLIFISVGALLAAAAVGCGSSETSNSGGSASTTSTSSAGGGGGSSTTGTGGEAATSTTSSSATSSGTGGGGGGMAVEPSCATTGKKFLLCEDFEGIDLGGVPDPTIWKIDKGMGATVAVDDAQFKHGKHAIHLHTLATASKALLHETKTFPLPGGKNSIYGRANFLLGQGINVPKNHTNLFEASGKVNGVNGNYRYGSSNGHFLANYNPGDPTKSSATNIPKGVWSCMEWAFLGDTNEMRFWLDGVELTDIAIPSTGVKGMVWTAPTFNSLYFGWITYAQDMASDHYDIWYDDIALDTARIGCDK
jgi:hypothetical protein